MARPEYTYNGIPYGNVSVEDEDNSIRTEGSNGTYAISPHTAQRWRLRISFSGGRDEKLTFPFLASLEGQRKPFTIQMPQSIFIIKRTEEEEGAYPIFAITPANDPLTFKTGDTQVMVHYSGYIRYINDFFDGMFVNLAGADETDIGHYKTYMLNGRAENRSYQSEYGDLDTRYSMGRSKVNIYPAIDRDITLPEIEPSTAQHLSNITRVRYRPFMPGDVYLRVVHAERNNSVQIRRGLIQRARWDFIEHITRK